MIEYKVKQSRLMIILATVAAGIFEIIFLFFSIAFLFECKNKQLTSDEYAVYIMSSVIGGIFALIIYNNTYYLYLFSSNRCLFERQDVSNERK